MPSSYKPPRRPPSRPSSSSRPDYSHRQTGGSSALKSVLLVGLGVLITACIGLSLVAYQRADACLNGSIRDCLGLATPTPTVTVGQVLSTLYEASDLVTAVAQSETRVKLEQSETFFDLFETGRTIDMEYHAYGTVRTSIDLSQISDWDVRISNDLVIVNLPPPQILSVEIDVNRSYVADVQKPFLALNDPDPRLVTYAQQEAEKAILEDVCAQGILDEANVNAVKVLGDLLAQTSPLPVQIVTQSGVCR